MITQNSRKSLTLRRATGTQCGAVITLAVVALLVLSPVTVSAKPYRGAEYRTKQSFAYGRFEVRMKSAPVSGMLSSFFTYHDNDVAANWNEIDIEIMGRYSNEVQYNVITTYQTNHVQRQVVKFNPHDGFHVHAIEWTPGYVAWYVDGFEIYRQTGSHITTVSRAQKLMMNIWQPADVGWAGPFSNGALPAYAYYDWAKFYEYTPGIGDNFTLGWTDNFDSFDATRWEKATHTWDGNNSVFVQNNVAFQNGYMILCLTDSVHSGYGGAQIVDRDVDAPYLVAARAYDNTVSVLFSEQLEKRSAETPTNYVAAGITVKSAVLQPDGRTVVLTVDGMNLSTPFTLIVVGVQDTALPAHAVAGTSIRVIMPLSLPIKINVGGSGAVGYRGDSVWAFAKEYGGVGGSSIVQPPSLQISGTSEPEVYHSALEGLTAYKVRVPNGVYSVTLMMAETKYNGSGQRVFNVGAQGRLVVDRCDLFQQVGMNTAYEKTIVDVAVNDGVIDVQFTPVVDKPILSGLRFERVLSAVERGEAILPGLRFDLYPNPFNGTTVFHYSLPGTDDVSIAVFDVTGKEIWARLEGARPGGEHTLAWDGAGLASGVYFFKFAAGRGTMVKKGLLLK